MGAIARCSVSCPKRGFKVTINRNSLTVMHRFEASLGNNRIVIRSKGKVFHVAGTTAPYFISNEGKIKCIAIASSSKYLFLQMLQRNEKRKSSDLLVQA